MANPDGVIWKEVKNASTLSNLTYHIVFSTKYRELFITPELRSELYPYIGGSVRNKGGALIRIGGVADQGRLGGRWSLLSTYID